MTAFTYFPNSQVGSTLKNIPKRNNGVTQMVKDVNPQKESKVALELEISDILKDRADEILETGDFTNMSDLINHALFHFIHDYERSRNEYLSDMLGDLEQYL